MVRICFSLANAVEPVQQPTNPLPSEASSGHSSPATPTSPACLCPTSSSKKAWCLMSFLLPQLMLPRSVHLTSSGLLSMQTVCVGGLSLRGGGLRQCDDSNTGAATLTIAFRMTSQCAPCRFKTHPAPLPTQWMREHSTLSS